jgi:two-component system, chemotaxis family, CheB/CheR fusion protein
MPHDVGRPLSNINPGVELPDFHEMVKQVMANPQTIERTLSDREENSYRLRVVPYKLADDRIDGTVITVAMAGGGSPREKSSKPGQTGSN